MTDQIQKPTHQSLPSRAHLSADSCDHTLLISPTLRSTLLPSGCSVDEAAGGPVTILGTENEVTAPPPRRVRCMGNVTCTPASTHYSSTNTKKKSPAHIAQSTYFAVEWQCSQPVYHTRYDIIRPGSNGHENFQRQDRGV